MADYCAGHQPSVLIQALREAAGAERQRPSWQPTRHPIAIRGARFRQQKLDYSHGNPVRNGLVRYPQDGPFSSPRYYATGNNDGEDVTITQITW